MSSSLLDQYRYTISDIKLLGPPVTYLTFQKPIFLIQITKITNGDKELLKSVTGTSVGKNQIAWSEQTLEDVTAESTINFKILMKKGKTGGLEANIGEYTNTVSGLLDNQKSSRVCKVTLDKKSQLSFTVKRDRFNDMLNRAKQQNEGIYFARGMSWSTFLTYFGMVKMAIDPIASLNPYTRQAWSILSIAPNILQMHAARNSNVKKLLQRLMDIYKYINEADRLPVLTDTQSEKLKLLIDQTCDCADFIKKYIENNAAENFIKGPIFDGSISEFMESFDQIFKAIQDSLIIGIGIAAFNIEDSSHLDGIPYATNVGLVHGKKCLPGTRTTLIRGILEWVDKDTPERVLILSGQAGTGKSAVAHTVAEKLNDRLGSFFCFSRSDKGRIGFLFSTISRDLADGDVLWRRNLVQSTEKIAIRKSFDPVTQFNEMIIKPSIGTTKRVVIIIDALDESGAEKERKTLLNLLFERSSELPANYRIIITSRPEHDITQFHRHSNVCCKYMADVDHGDTLNDIQQFISVELSPVAEILPDVVDKNWHLLLAQKAQGLFQWAKIACGYILELELEAAQRLRHVLSKPTSSLYEMYHQILDAQPDCKHSSHLTLLKTLVGAVMVSRKPLTASALQGFFGRIRGDGMDVKVVLKSLNSLFIGTNESTVELRPIHTSLFDFFLDPEQKPGTRNRYYIDTSDQSSFTHACLRVMNGMLQFNICRLETSHLRNRDIPDFDFRVAEAIPSHLSYACCFWAYHLDYSSLNADLLENIYDLMCNKLLYFFEVLSLLGEVEYGRIGMRILKFKTKDENRELAARAAEVSQFTLEFGPVMMESTPHLYLSSLPYISNRSFMYQQFLPQYPNLLSMDVGRPISLQPKIKGSISQRHPSSARPIIVAFSPQGRQIATGFDNGDLWVWDYVTGEIITQVGPKDKPSIICNVVFSLNGDLVYCCFQDGNILTWEAKTKKVLYESNEKLALGECYDCTTSPDGRYIAFKHGTNFSPDDIHCRVSFFERKTNFKLFDDSFESIGKMMFSPSGSLFGFQSGDILRLWDTQRPMFVPDESFVFKITKPGTLEALHDNYAITYFYGSANVWDIRTRAMVLRLVPESRSLGGVTFSPNGEYLLRSEGNKRWIWNMSTGEITQRFVEHSDKGLIALTALSSDSKHITFGTLTNDTMHVLEWDALAREEEDLSKDIEGRDRLRNPGPCDRAEAWLKGQHLLWKVQYTESRSDLRVFDTTRMTDLIVDFHVDLCGGLVEVSPEDKHWSIVYVDASRADLLFLWNIDEKTEFILDRSVGEVTALAFSATGDRLLSGDSKGNIKIWHVRTRQLISHGRLSKWVTALAFSPMGTTFWVAYGTDGHAFVEERECPQSQNIINGPFIHRSTIHSISVSSNDAYICLCGRKYPYVLLLDRSTGASIRYFKTPQPPRFSSNRRYISWMSKKSPRKAELWDLEKGIALDRHPFEGGIRAYELFNDSTRIVLDVVGEMQRIDIWDIETKGLVMQLFSSDFQLDPAKQTWQSHTMALYQDRLLWVGTLEKGRVWDLHVHEIMTHVYDDNMDNSQSGMLPGHLQTRRLIGDYKSRSENTEVLDYALVAWNKASFSPRTKKSEDGWMLDPDGKLLFWVPPEMRNGLWYPSMTFTTREKPTKLNFDKFVHGTRWTECRMQPKP